jgi:ATP-binding cassette, subfamily B, bacterial
VPSNDLTPFQRIFAWRDLFRGAALRAGLWHLASSLLLCAALIDLYLITDLLVHGGELHVAGEKAVELEVLIGLRPPEDAAKPNPADAPAVKQEIIYRDRGILPTVWRDRNKPWGPLTAAVYREVTLLQNDELALETLIALAALLGWFRSMMDSRARMILLRLSLDIATRLRKSIHRQTLRVGTSDLDGKSGQQALELFTTDVERVREGVHVWAARVGRDPLQLALLLTLAISVHPSLAVICLVPIAGCWYIATRTRQKNEEFRRLAEARADHELHVLAEGLQKTRLVRGYGMEAFEQQQFEKFLNRFEENTANTLKVKAWSRRGLRTLIVVCAAVVLLYVGGNILLPPRSLPIASAMLMLLSFAAAVVPLQNLARLLNQHGTAETAAARVHHYLSAIPEVGQAVGAKFLQPLAKMLTFEGVAYTGPDKTPLLHDLNLRIPAGRKVAIVSTDPLESRAVAYLLPRFIEPQQGRILFDGEDISWVTLESLRAECIFVGGRDPFFTGTVRENISCGQPHYSLQDVTEAAKVAHAHNFIQKLPQGYETMIGEHGEQLDVGQSFRLGLARAILRKPALLIIEEPAEPIDEETKTMLDDTYHRIAQNRTVLFIPSRLSTLKRADEIAFIHNGRLAAIGPHPRLVQTAPLYRHWEYLHFNEFRHEFEAE